jgi:probable O-glycosylation ligase (exosortase A-associated)
MRDLLVFLVVLLSLPTSFRRPFVGMLVFSWLAYMRPQDLCWSFARDMRLSFYVAIAMLLGWWANERGRRAFARWDVRSRLLLAMVALVSISYALARVHTDYSNRYYVEFLKIIVVALFTTGQVDSRQRFRALVWTIAACLAFYGVKGGLKGVLTGGTPILRGPGGMLEDNNDFALALIMNVPLLWYLGHNERALPYVRTATRIGVFLTVVTIALTHSRGGFLALVGTALWIAWRSGRLFRAVAGLGAAGIAFFTLAPRGVLDRLSTIGDTHESSTAARLTSWRTASRMIADNPIWGVGLRNFQPRYLDYALVRPDENTTTYVAHNSYLQIWAECGSLAFGVYFVLLLSVFVACRRVWRVGMALPHMRWAADYARMMEATTVGFMIGATFLNRGHFDLVYHWLALVTALVGITWIELRADAPSPAPAGPLPGGEVTVRARRVRLAPALVAGKPAPRWGRAR